MRSYSLFQAARSYATRSSASAAKKITSVKPPKPVKIVKSESAPIEKEYPKEKYTPPASDGWGSENHESPYAWGKYDYLSR